MYNHHRSYIKRVCRALRHPYQCSSNRNLKTILSVHTCQISDTHSCSLLNMPNMPIELNGLKSAQFIVKLYFTFQLYAV